MTKQDPLPALSLSLRASSNRRPPGQDRFRGRQLDRPLAPKTGTARSRLAFDRYGAGVSQENVELVRRGIEVINRGEVDAILAFVDEVADPEVEFRAVGRLPDTRKVQRGPDAVKAWWAQLLEAFDWKLEADELIDAGDAVVVIARQKGRGRESGAEVTDRTIQVFGFREGKVTYIDAYRTEREALEAAGLKD